MVGKKRAKTERKAAAATAPKTTVSKGGEGKTVPQPPQTRIKKEPKSAVVTVTAPPGRYEEVMREARLKINPVSLGIPSGMKISKGITGALKFEVPGKESS